MTINIAALQYAFLYNALKTCAFLLWKLKVFKKTVLGCTQSDGLNVVAQRNVNTHFFCLLYHVVYWRKNFLFN